MQEILKGSFIIFIFKLLGAGSLFFIYVLIPRHYGVEAFGTFNIIFALLMIATMFARIGLDTYVLKQIPTLETNQKLIPLFLKKVLQILLVSSLIVTTILLLLSHPLDHYLFKSSEMYDSLLILSIMILPYTLFNVFPEIFRGFGEIKIYAFFRNFLQNFMLALLLVITVLFSLEYRAETLLYLTVMLLFVSISITLYFFLKKRQINLFKQGQEPYREKILKYSYPMFLSASIMFIMSYIDGFMIAYYLDEYQVGIYSACVNISMLITFIPIAIGGYLSPKVAKAYADDNKEEIKQLFKNSLTIIFMVTLPLFLFIYFYAETLLALFGVAFTVATTTLLITNIAFLSEALTGPVGFIMNMTNKQHLFMKILAISLLINILFNALLIPHYGINGAATAMMLSMFFWSIGSFVYLKRKEII
ncbi:MAG TPA: flippase [Campylobacterales bacterium]|nr:flippase [Campylobacterales bacterium]HHS93658.1 flippase [Campylobacterales bacterium]